MSFSSASSFTDFQPPPISLYFFAAQPLAYAEGYTSNLAFACAFACAHFSGLVGTFFSSSCFISSLNFPFPKLETFIGFPCLSGFGSCRLFALTAAALSFLESAARFSFDIHLGLASPGSLAQGPIASPLLLILFQPPFGCFGSNHCLKSSLMFFASLSNCFLVALTIPENRLSPVLKSPALSAADACSPALDL